ncbi:restriction endonuclease subunit S [Acinetobacter baumannii]|nr:restriction endonuclease subunit S [Acinetobacter baumannii]
MTDVKELITEHLDIWLTAEAEKKSGRGRSSGSSNSIYGVQKLRELILELAVTGKLVKNITYKNDAKVLINQIKVDLSKSNIKYKVSKPRDLPKGWAWAFIDEIAESNIGLTYSPKDVSLHGIPVLRSSNIQNGKIDLNDLVRVNTVIKDNLWVQENDLLICARNGSKRLVGKTAKISGLNEPMTFGAFMAILRSPLNDYLEVFLKSPLFRKELDSVETTTINQITQKNLKNTVVPIPPKEIQTVIVKKVDELMQLCDQLEQQQNLSLEAHDQLVDTFLSVLINSSDVDEFKQNWQHISENFDLLFTTEYSIEQLKQTILQLAVMGKLVKQDPNDEPASELLKQIAEEKARLVKEGKIKKSKPLPEIMDEEKPFEVPNGWEWVRIADIAQIIEYGTSYKTNDNDSVPVYRMGNIQNGLLLEENLKYLSKGCDDLPRLYLKKGDILFNRTNSYELVGKSAVYLGEDNHATFASYLIRVRLYPTINPIFINQVINSPYYRTTQIEPEITQQCGQANFNGTKLASTVIPLPNLLMQTKIIEKLKEIYSLIDNLNLLFLELRKNKVLLADSLVNNALADLKHKENPKSTNNIIQFEKPIEAVKQPKQKSADQIDLFADDSGEDDIKLLSLAAEITFQLHTEPTFGHLKLQKLVYLCQQLKHMDLAADFKQHAAGPYDPVMARYLDKEFKNREWFSYDPKRDLKYKPLSRCNDHRSAFNRYFAEDVSEIYDLIGLFRTSKSDHIEIVATLFACWLRLLEKKLSVTEEQLLKDFYAWSEEKKRFSKAEVLTGYKWMQQYSVIPQLLSKI